MKILAIDDEKLLLNELVYQIREALPSAEVDFFTSSVKALESAQKVKYDVVFSDIQMPKLTGIELAKQLKRTNPKVNIIFVTGYSEYMDEAIRLHVSGYLKKPVTADDIRQELDNLIHPMEVPKNEVFAQTFGNFCLFVNGKPVHFRRDRSEEMLAYLIDRRGAAISRKEVAATLFEDSDFNRTEQTYLSLIAHDLAEDLKKAGIEGLFVKSLGSYRVDVNQFRCDAYEYLAGDAGAINRFGGEYMEQYSWAEYLKGKFYGNT